MSIFKVILKNVVEQPQGLIVFLLIIKTKTYIQLVQSR